MERVHGRVPKAHTGVAKLEGHDNDTGRNLSIHLSHLVTHSYIFCWTDKQSVKALHLRAQYPYNESLTHSVASRETYYA